MISKLNSIDPGRFFQIVALVSGIFMLLITPPFQAPDEINHFYKAYQISEGKFFSENNDHRLGGFVPKSFVEITEPFSRLRFNIHEKADFLTLKNLLSIPLNEQDRVFVDFPNTALYSPISYLPQALALFVLTELSLPPLFILYLTRFLMLILWIGCIALAIKITPIYKWLFVLLALLPMSIFTHAALSADSVTDILGFLLLATLFKTAYEAGKFDTSKFLILACLTIMLASAKLVYTPLIFLFALIPIEKFKNTRWFFSYFVWLLVIGFGTAFLWSKSINGLYTPYADYNPAFRNGIDLIEGAHIHDQIEFIFHNIFYVILIFAKSLVHAFDMYYQGYIGYFGWLDTRLPYWLIHFSYGIIILTAVFENNNKVSFLKWQKLIIASSIATMVGLILMSQYLTWIPVGGERINVLQGRYFTIVFPLLFFLLNNPKYNRQKLIVATVTLYSILILACSAWTIYSRYYIPSVFKSSTIVCDAEETTDQGKFITTGPHIMLENGSAQSKEISRSGMYSAQLNADYPIAFRHVFNTGKMGDIIDIKVWRYGKWGGIAFDIELDKDWRYFSTEVVDTDSSGWEQLHLKFTNTSNRKSKAGIFYIENNNDETSYFDDLEITIHRVK